MIVQIYEIQTPGEARAMIDLGVDHIGSVITSAARWQNPELKETIDTVRAAGRKSSLIALFTDLSTISSCIDYYQPDILHLCETLPTDPGSDAALDAIVERQTLLREKYPRLALMRSIPIPVNGMQPTVSPLHLAGKFEPVSDWFLTDTLLVAENKQSSPQDQPVAGYVGITGRTCDWETVRQLVDGSRIPVILAGGIGPDNAYDGILRTNPAGVDSCTRTNAVDQNGKPVRFSKDPDKVKQLIENVRRAELARKAELKLNPG